MEMSRPDERHARLHPLVGTWRGRETMPPSQWAPEGASAVAMIVNRLGVGGFTLIQDYTQSREGRGGTFIGHGVLWVDPEDGATAMTWWDSTGAAPDVFRGLWHDEQTLVMTSVSPLGHNRGTRVLVGRDKYRHTLEMSPDGEVWSTFMEGEYRKVG